MSCNCNKPKCNGKCGISPSVLQINNPGDCTLFHRVEVPASMGDSKTNPPKNGDYRNVLLYYVADGTSWLFSSDGIPQKLVSGFTDYEDAINLPQINGHTIIGNKTSHELGLQGELTAGDNIQINDNTISATDTTYTAGNGIELADTEIKAKIGDGLGFDDSGNIKNTVGENKLTIFAPDYDNSGDLSVYKFNKGEDERILIVDFGTYSADSYSKLKEKLLAFGASKFDYAIISHYHVDHVGMLSYMVNDPDFDFSECIFYLPPTPDYSRFVGSARYIPQYESDIKAMLISKNIHYNIPDNSTELIILDDFRIYFYNCDLADYETYYDVTSEVEGQQVTVYNNFSIVNEIEFDGKRVLLTGDIEEAAEVVVSEQIKNVPDVLKVEHHARNSIVNQKYLNTICKAKINFVMLNRTEVQPYVLSENGQLYHTNYSSDIVIDIDINGVRATSENGPLPSDYTKFDLTNINSVIPSGANLNDYNSAGDYVVQSSAIAATITNTPTTGHAYRLITIEKNSSDRINQYALENTSDIVYCRTYNNGSWGAWRIIQNGGDLAAISTSTNVNNLPYGNYQSGPATSATLTNLPTELSNKRIMLSVNRFNNDGSIVQIAQGRLMPTANYPLIYYRIKPSASESFSDWFRLNNTFPIIFSANADLNDYKTEGKYYSESAQMTGTISNKPSGMSSYSFTLEVVKTVAIEGRCYQKLTVLHDPLEVYERIYLSGGWTPWYQINATVIS